MACYNRPPLRHPGLFQVISITEGLGTASDEFYSTGNKLKASKVLHPGSKAAGHLHLLTIAVALAPCQEARPTEALNSHNSRLLPSLALPSSISLFTVFPSALKPSNLAQSDTPSFCSCRQSVTHYHIAHLNPYCTSSSQHNSTNIPRAIFAQYSYT